jgi:hypothetical protein
VYEDIGRGQGVEHPIVREWTDEGDPIGKATLSGPALYWTTRPEAVPDHVERRMRQPGSNLSEGFDRSDVFARASPSPTCSERRGLQDPFRRTTSADGDHRFDKEHVDGRHRRLSTVGVMQSFGSGEPDGANVAIFHNPIRLRAWAMDALPATRDFGPVCETDGSIRLPGEQTRFEHVRTSLALRSTRLSTGIRDSPLLWRSACLTRDPRSSRTSSSRSGLK